MRVTSRGGRRFGLLFRKISLATSFERRELGIRAEAGTPTGKRGQQLSQEMLVTLDQLTAVAEVVGVAEPQCVLEVNPGGFADASDVETDGRRGAGGESGFLFEPLDACVFVWAVQLL